MDIDDIEGICGVVESMRLTVRRRADDEIRTKLKEKCWQYLATAGQGG